MDRLLESTIGTGRPAAARAYAPSGRKTFALMHIPKCAGTSLMNSITLSIGPGRHVVGFDRSLFGDFRQFDSIPKIMRSVIYLDPASMPPDAATVMGHFSHSTLRHRYPEADLAIFLREPTVRVLSHWTYWRSLTWFSLRHWGGEWSERLKRARLPLRDFLSRAEIACQTDNIITRMLVWPHRLLPDDQFIDPVNDEALLALALENLENCDFAGITERGAAAYREFSDWLGSKLDLPTLNPAQKMRRAARTKLDSELTPATLDLLHARVRLDSRIWKRLATLSMSPSEADRLQQNAILQAIARFSVLLA
jgi:hypothetical protein